MFSFEISLFCDCVLGVVLCFTLNLLVYTWLWFGWYCLCLWIVCLFCDLLVWSCILWVCECCWVCYIWWVGLVYDVGCFSFRVWFVFNSVVMFVGFFILIFVDYCGLELFLLFRIFICLRVKCLFVGYCAFVLA